MLTNEEKQDKILAEIKKIHPQLKINEKKVAGAGLQQWSDLLSFHIEYFLERPIEFQWKICFIDNKLEHYITSSMKMVLHSKTSPYFMSLRKPMLRSRELLEIPYILDNTVEVNENENKITFIKEYVDGLEFYEQALIQDHYYNGISIQEIGKKYSITEDAIRKDVRRVLKQLKNELIKKQYTI